MILVRVEGGLGNQLFQYAFGRQLASHHKTELVLDLSSYEPCPPHGYLLNRFDINAREMRSDERNRIPKRYQGANRSWFRTLAFNPNGLTKLRERP
jgi:hypothetical protein